MKWTMIGENGNAWVTGGIKKVRIPPPGRCLHCGHDVFYTIDDVEYCCSCRNENVREGKPIWKD